jgi:hypothetical protein
MLPVLMTTSSRTAPAGKRMWCTTGRLLPDCLSASNTRRDACTREVPSATFSSATVAPREEAAASCASVSVPSISMARRAAPPGRGTAPLLLLLSASLRLMSATAPSRGSAARAALGAITCTPTFGGDGGGVGV